MPDPRPPAPRIPAAPVPLVLWLLVGGMGLIEAVLSGADAGLIGAPDWREIAFDYGAFWPGLWRGTLAPLYPGQPYAMFLSHAFLHGGMLHYAMNATILLALGKFISERIGPARMLAVFVISAVAGGVVFQLLAAGPGPMIGASGAGFGFLGLWQYWEARARLRLRLSLRPVWSVVIALALANVALLVAFNGGLAWQAHLGGFLAGIALGPWSTRVMARRAARG